MKLHRVLIFVGLTSCLLSPLSHAANPLCELPLAKDSGEFLKRFIGDHPHPSLKLIQDYHRVLKNLETGTWESLKETPYFATPESSKNLRLEFRKIFKNAQVRLTAENNNPHLLRQVRDVLKAQQNYFDWLATSNIRLALSIVDKFRHLNLEADDLISGAYLGLKRAAELFDPERGFQFSTYATDWIVTMISRANSSTSNTIKIPANVHEKLARYKRAKETLTYRLGHSPSNVELAQEMKVSVEMIARLEDALMSATRSLDAPINKNDRESLLDLIADPADNAPDLLHAHQKMTQLNELMKKTLTPYEQEVMALRLRATESGESMTYVETGLLMGRSPEAISKTERLAIQKLKAAQNAGQEMTELKETTKQVLAPSKQEVAHDQKPAFEAAKAPSKQIFGLSQSRRWRKANAKTR